MRFRSTHRRLARRCTASTLAGLLANTAIPADRLAELQTNLILCTAGSASAAAHVVRLMII
jgi:hypothetical protein